MRKKDLNEKILKGSQRVILVDDKIEGATYLPWHSLLPFQGELKTSTEESREKLLKSLIEEGFFDIKKVWRDTDGQVFILDGHQTISVLTQFRPELESGQIQLLRKSDNKPTDLIPCVFINAASREELARRLLLINSQYGKITSEGLQRFMADFNINLDFAHDTMVFDVGIPNVDFMPFGEITAPPEQYDSDTDNATDSNQIEGERIPSTEIPPEEEKEAPDKELISEDYVEYPLILKKAEKDYIANIIKRVKTELVFEKNSDAILHIFKQYETYVLEV